MKYKYPLSHDDVKKLKIELKKRQWLIENELSAVIETLENVIDEKDKEIDELNKKIEELKQPKKAKILALVESNCQCFAPDNCRLNIIAFISSEISRYEMRNRFVLINGIEFYCSDIEEYDNFFKVKFIAVQRFRYGEPEKFLDELARLRPKTIELGEKVEELEKPKKTVKHQFFDFTEVEFHRVTSDQFIVSADVYISPELHRIFKQVTFYINGNEFYIGKCEVIKGRIKAKVISSASYDIEAAQIIAKDLLSNDIYGNIKA